MHAQSCLTLQSHRLQPTRLPCPWEFPGKNTGVGCHFLLQGSFPNHWTQDTYGSCIGKRILFYWATWEAWNYTLVEKINKAISFWEISSQVRVETPHQGCFSLRKLFLLEVCTSPGQSDGGRVKVVSVSHKLPFRLSLTLTGIISVHLSEPDLHGIDLS